MVDGDAERRADGVLTAVALAYAVLLVVVRGEVEFQVVDNLACLLGQTVLLNKRHDGALDGSEGLRQVQDHTLVAAFELLLLVTGAKHAEEHAVDAD